MMIRTSGGYRKVRFNIAGMYGDEFEMDNLEDMLEAAEFCWKHGKGFTVEISNDLPTNDIPKMEHAEDF